MFLLTSAQNRLLSASAGASWNSARIASFSRMAVESSIRQEGAAPVRTPAGALTSGVISGRAAGHSRAGANDAFTDRTLPLRHSTANGTPVLKLSVLPLRVKATATPFSSTAENSASGSVANARARGRDSSQCRRNSKRKSSPSSAAYANSCSGSPTMPCPAVHSAVPCSPTLESLSRIMNSPHS